ncbi:SH3 domain-containing C40 family peptidase [Mesobacillus foraminis]|uniref:C40 family peptidase n=1 Tax=Mesobacillus foraminis TaxID=279826 RepID=UPI002034F978|nr:SH3 domain-containing C40 family peptidase [Mesobacillus foraminis]
MLKRILAVLLLFALVTTIVPSLDKASAAGTSYYVKIDSGSLNVRKSPSTKAAIVTRLAKGKTVTVSSQSKGWAKVTANGKNGYVSSKYIAKKTTTTAKKTTKKATTTNYRTKAISVGKGQLGVKYRWGGTTPSGFDCSGFVGYSFKKAGKSLPRTAGQMYNTGTRVSKPAPGDLMFYATSGGRKVTHVAIYIGNGQIMHATTSKGVAIDSINNTYWKPRFIGAKRI